MRRPLSQRLPEPGGMSPGRAGREFADEAREGAADRRDGGREGGESSRADSRTESLSSGAFDDSLRVASYLTGLGGRLGPGTLGEEARRRMRDLAPGVLLARYGRGGPSDELLEEARRGVADPRGPDARAQGPPRPPPPGTLPLAGGDLASFAGVHHVQIVDPTPCPPGHLTIVCAWRHNSRASGADWGPGRWERMPGLPRPLLVLPRDVWAGHML
jgi:hypothetical protein